MCPIVGASRPLATNLRKKYQIISLISKYDVGRYYDRGKCHLLVNINNFSKISKDNLEFFTQRVNAILCFLLSDT